MPMENFLFTAPFLGARDIEVDKIDKAPILTRYHSG